MRAVYSTAGQMQGDYLDIKVFIVLGEKHSSVECSGNIRQYAMYTSCIHQLYWFTCRFCVTEKMLHGPVCTVHSHYKVKFRQNAQRQHAVFAATAQCRFVSCVFISENYIWLNKMFVMDTNRCDVFICDTV